MNIIEEIKKLGIDRADKRKELRDLDKKLISRELKLEAFCKTNPSFKGFTQSAFKEYKLTDKEYNELLDKYETLIYELDHIDNMIKYYQNILDYGDMNERRIHTNIERNE